MSDNNEAVEQEQAVQADASLPAADHLVSGDGSHTLRVDNSGDILIYNNGNLQRKL